MRQNRRVPGRRLILLLVMLLVTLSVLSAGRDISRRGPAGQTTTTQTTTTGTTTTPQEERSGDRASRSAARKDGQPVVSRTVRQRLPSNDPLRAKLGERVLLQIRTERPDILVVDGLGVRAPTGPGTPGTLDFVAGSAGSWEVTLAIAGRRVGEVLVR